MSCVRDTSPSAGSKNAEDTGKQESKKRRFHPFRGLRRIFRRKPRAHERGPANPDSPHSSREGLSPEEPSRDSTGIEAQCSRSASQLIQDPSQARRSLHSTVLSVSHDSIFSPDIHPESQLGSVLSVQKLGHSNIRAELFDAVRRRKGREDTSEEDLGLPRSPLSNSLTTTDALSDANKDVRIAKSPHSTCSDGSLLSMGSSEMDDDFYGHGSRNSSKLSLYDRKSLNQEADTGVDLNASVASTQLSHSAARHKMAIKPKRTHGAPRRNKQLAIGSVLPSTPELNEDVSSRSLSSQTSDSGIYPTYESSYIYNPLDHDPNKRNFDESFDLPPRRSSNSNIGSVRSYVSMLNYKNSVHKSRFYDTHHFNKMILNKVPNYSQEEVNRSTLELQKIISKFEKISNKQKGSTSLKNSRSEINLSKDFSLNSSNDSDLRKRVVNELSELYFKQNHPLLKHKSYSDIPHVIYNFTGGGNRNVPAVSSLRVPSKDSRAALLKCITLDKNNFEIRKSSSYSQLGRVRKSKINDNVFVRDDRGSDREFKLRPLPFPDYSDLQKLDKYHFKVLNKSNREVKLEKVNSPMSNRIKQFRRNNGVNY